MGDDRRTSWRRHRPNLQPRSPERPEIPRSARAIEWGFAAVCTHTSGRRLSNARPGPRVPEKLARLVVKSQADERTWKGRSPGAKKAASSARAMSRPEARDRRRREGHARACIKLLLGESRNGRTEYYAPGRSPGPGFGPTQLGGAKVATPAAAARRRGAPRQAPAASATSPTRGVAAGGRPAGDSAGGPDARGVDARRRVAVGWRRKRDLMRVCDRNGGRVAMRWRRRPALPDSRLVDRARAICATALIEGTTTCPGRSRDTCPQGGAGGHQPRRGTNERSPRRGQTTSRRIGRDASGPSYVPRYTSRPASRHAGHQGVPRDRNRPRITAGTRTCSNGGDRRRPRAQP